MKGDYSDFVSYCVSMTASLSVTENNKQVVCVNIMVLLE